MSVYFIKPVGMDGPIKIGTSVSPDGRRHTLDGWSPFALEIVAEIEGGGRIERQFHALLQPWHQRREWFEGSTEVWAVVNQVIAGTFDMSTLPDPASIVVDKAKVSASHRATWTPERKIKASYCQRIRWAERKTGTKCPHSAALVSNPDIRAKIDTYLADPAAHTKPLGVSA